MLTAPGDGAKLLPAALLVKVFLDISPWAPHYAGTWSRAAVPSRVDDTPLIETAIMRDSSRATVLLCLALLVPLAPGSAQSAAFGATALRVAVAPALDDPTIVAIFDAANSWDIETSQVALKKSRNKEVRRFATMMVHDHRAVRKLGRDLARKLHVTPTPPGKDFALYKDHVDAMATLRREKGAAFDKAYIDHEVTYHQAVIDAVTKELLPGTQNADLKALETKVAPNFQAHLAAAQKVQAGLASK